ETEADAAALQAHLTERFVDDMDGQLRQMGIGDIVVGKHIGKMMSMLGGRLGAYRDGLAAGDLAPALVRNLYRGEAPASAALALDPFPRSPEAETALREAGVVSEDEHRPLGALHGLKALLDKG